MHTRLSIVFSSTFRWQSARRRDFRHSWEFRWRWLRTRTYYCFGIGSLMFRRPGTCPSVKLKVYISVCGVKVFLRRNSVRFLVFLRLTVWPVIRHVVRSDRLLSTRCIDVTGFPALFCPCEMFVGYFPRLTIVAVAPRRSVPRVSRWRIAWIASWSATKFQWNITWIHPRWTTQWTLEWFSCLFIVPVMRWRVLGAVRRRSSMYWVQMTGTD